MMNNLKNIIDKIDNLNHKINQLRPLSKEQEAKLIQKLRLDWNYHSCNVEGNTLTYGETKDLLFYGITAKGKPFKDHIEIKGHNEAIKWIYEIIKQNRPLNENFIRELHELIIAPDSYTNVKTAEGIHIKKQILRGEYKQTPNHVQTKTGEIFYFASPEETPAKMNDLIQWFREINNKKETHPLIIASLFHYKFVRIHPFDDGNGRMSRILMNFILMIYGFPPVIIPTDEKSDYITALEYADKEDINKFIEYVGEKLLHSLELLLKVAKGESIEDETDLDKKLLILDKHLESIDDDLSIKKSRTVENQKEVFEICLKPLLEAVFSKLSKFDKYFVEIHHYIDSVDKTFKDLEDLIKQIKERLNSTIFYEISIEYTYSSFIKLGLPYYKFPVVLKIKFDEYDYKIGLFLRKDKELELICHFEKLYHQFLYSDEIQDITKKIEEHILNEIYQKIKEKEK